MLIASAAIRSSGHREELGDGDGRHPGNRRGIEIVQLVSLARM
jgi:hypothetical protein